MTFWTSDHLSSLWTFDFQTGHQLSAHWSLGCIWVSCSILLKVVFSIWGMELHRRTIDKMRQMSIHRRQWQWAKNGSFSRYLWWLRWSWFIKVLLNVIKIKWHEKITKSFKNILWTRRKHLLFYPIADHRRKSYAALCLLKFSIILSLNKKTNHPFKYHESEILKIIKFWKQFARTKLNNLSIHKKTMTR